MPEVVCSRCGLQPDRTQEDRSSPWEVAKTCVFSAVLQRRGTPRETMHSWPVDAFADFLCGQDLCGPAAGLQDAGVVALPS